MMVDLPSKDVVRADHRALATFPEVVMMMMGQMRGRIVTVLDVNRSPSTEHGVQRGTSKRLVPVREVWKVEKNLPPPHLLDRSCCSYPDCA